MSDFQIFTNTPEGFSTKVQVAACYLQADDRYLFLQNADHKVEAGKWGVPAGKLEKYEDHHEAAIRELCEETGIELTHTAQINYLDAIYIRKLGIEYVYHMFKVQLSDLPMVQLSDEHQDFKWVTSIELGTLPLMAAALEAFNHYEFLDRR